MTAEGQARTIGVANDYCQGRFLYFSSQLHDLGWPPNWMLNPFNGAKHHADLHWCDYPTFSKELGDIKEVWEPSRFACAYWLVRAYALTRDEKYPEAFWVLFESWVSQNPPNMGPNWKCGQETAIRLFAWCFALWGFWKSPATTADRVASIVRLIAIQAERIYHNIDYAISLKNNHSISEATGLLTVGLLFPEFRESARWLARGFEVLEADARRQIYDDGSFVQHSMNYHRVMLHDFLWAIRLADLNGQPLSDELKRRVRLASEFLFELMDEASGHVPNYGPNDGALVLPLDSQPYEDFRGTVQAAAAILEGRRVLPDGAWDETTLWLAGPEALRTSPQVLHPASQSFEAGGYHTIRTDDCWAMMRCHTYRDRPTHVDMLHVDLWHRGVNVLSDSGTYKYYTPEAPGLARFFKDIGAHNTVEIDGSGPLELISHFMWLPWPKARCLDHGKRRIVGEHDAYQRAPWHVTHRRTLESTEGGSWIVTDEILGDGRHRVVLRWHCADCPATLGGSELRLETGRATMSLKVEGPAGVRVDLRRGDEAENDDVGWQSLHYRERTPRPVLVISGEFDLPVRLVTRIQFTDA